jgi:predicted permease
MRSVVFAVRRLRRTPAFTATIVLTLALGIGLATAIYAVVDAVLLRRLPVADQDRIVVLSSVTPDGKVDNGPIPLTWIRRYAASPRTLQSVGYVSYEGAFDTPFQRGDDVWRLKRARVSGNFFDVLGAHPVRGRGFRPSDDVIGAAPVAVISQTTWQRRFAGDPEIVGKQLVQDAGINPYEIVGVMPSGLDYPTGVDIWVPAVPFAGGSDSTHASLYIVGRLGAGVSAFAARDEVKGFIQREMSSAPPPFGAAVRTLPEAVAGNVRPALMAFSVAVALLLLIACANVANLLLIRGFARAQDIAVRAALGASAGRIIGEQLVESAVLAVAGCAGGIVVAACVLRGLLAVAPADLPRISEIALNARAVAAAAGVATLAVVFFGLTPALVTARYGIDRLLRSGSRQTTRGLMSQPLTRTLVVAQVALAMLVLSAASVVVRSLVNLQHVDLAIESRHLLLAELTMRAGTYPSKLEKQGFMDQLIPAVENVAGVRAASQILVMPFAGTAGWDAKPAAEGQTEREQAGNAFLNVEVVSPNYFRTLGIAVREGRVFGPEDRAGAPVSVIVSQSTAQHYWPGQSALGKRFAAFKGGWFTVIGVVADTRYRDLRTARASLYFPAQQNPFPFAPTNLAIRTEGDPTSVVAGVRAAMKSLDPDVVIATATPFEAELAWPLSGARLNAILLAVFAGSATFLATLGLFGLIAATVRQRTRELGVRMALGATAGGVHRMLIKQGVILALAGTAVGLAAVTMTNRLLISVLYDVRPMDPLVLSSVGVLLIGSAFAASYGAARSVTRIDPAVALRPEQ